MTEDKVDMLHGEIAILRQEVEDRMYLANTVARVGFELSRALVEIMKRHGVANEHIAEELAAFARHRAACGSGDHNLENMLSNTVAILIADVDKRSVMMPAGHA